MGDRKPRGQRAPTDLALCEALAQDIEVASPPSQRTRQSRTTPAAHAGISDLYSIASRGEPPATISRLTGADDPILGCLLLLLRALQRLVPSAVLLEGLPVERQGMTLPLLCAAAARAGLSMQLMKRDLDALLATSLPAILLLSKNRPCVLLQRCEHGRLLVALPGWGGGMQEVSRDDLLAQYSGYAVFAEPQVDVSTDTESTQPCSWSGDVIRRNAPSHSILLLGFRPVRKWVGLAVARAIRIRVRLPGLRNARVGLSPSWTQ